MNAPDYTHDVRGIERTLQAIVTEVGWQWNDKQGSHFGIYHSEPILHDIRGLETGIQSPIDRITRELEEINNL